MQSAALSQELSPTQDPCVILPMFPPLLAIQSQASFLIHESTISLIYILHHLVMEYILHHERHKSSSYILCTRLPHIQPYHHYIRPYNTPDSRVATVDYFGNIGTVTSPTSTITFSTIITTAWKVLTLTNLAVEFST